MIQEFSKMKNRKQLPLIAKVPLLFDFNLLLEELTQFGLLNLSEFNDFDYSTDSPIHHLIEQNLEVRKLAMNDEEINKIRNMSDFRSENYRQYALTEANVFSQKNKALPPARSAKERIQRLNPLSKKYNPLADEANYGKLRSNVGPEMKALINKFVGELCRVRLSALLPEGKIKPHRDYDPSYLTRYHVPLLTNENSFFCFQVKDKIFKYNLLADGSIYFVNTGYIHWVENNGTTSRIHLMIDVKGQELLNNKIDEIAFETSL